MLGGWLIQAASWRWIFFLNLPLAAVTLAIVALHVPESRDEQEQGPLDWRGAVLATLGLGAIVYALISAGTAGLGSPLVLVTLVGGVGALVAFVLVERVVPSPLLPLGLFRSRTFTGTNLLTLLLYGALGGALFFLPFNLQQVQGYTALEAGASLLPFTIIMFTLSRWAGGLVTRYGAKLPLIIGPSISAVGFVLFARAGLGESYWTSFFPAVVVLALGMSVTVAPLTTAVMGSVDQAHAGVASGVNNAVSRAAGLLAIAVLGLVVASVFTSQLTGLLAALPISPELRHVMAAQASKLAGAQIPAGTSTATSAALRHAIDQAFLAGFRAAMLIGAGLAAASAIAAGLLIDGRVDAAAKPPTQTADAKERRAS